MVVRFPPLRSLLLPWRYLDATIEGPHIHIEDDYAGRLNFRRDATPNRGQA